MYTYIYNIYNNDVTHFYTQETTNCFNSYTSSNASKRIIIFTYLKLQITAHNEVFSSEKCIQHR